MCFFFSDIYTFSLFVLTALLDKGSLDFNSREFNSFLSGQFVKLSFSFKMSGVYIFHGKFDHARVISNTDTGDPDL